MAEETISNEVLNVKLDNLVAVQSSSHKEVREQLYEIKTSVDKMKGDFEVRIRSLEDWRLKFVAKFSVYSAIALALGSFAAQILIKFLGKII